MSSNLFQVVCCLDEWVNGVHTPISFFASEYKRKYDEILHMLETFAENPRGYIYQRLVSISFFFTTTSTDLPTVSMQVLTSTRIVNPLSFRMTPWPQQLPSTNLGKLGSLTKMKNSSSL
jgi:hypothetical protein